MIFVSPPSGRLSFDPCPITSSPHPIFSSITLQNIENTTAINPLKATYHSLPLFYLPDPSQRANPAPKHQLGKTRASTSPEKKEIVQNSLFQMFTSFAISDDKTYLTEQLEDQIYNYSMEEKRNLTGLLLLCLLLASAQAASSQNATYFNATYDSIVGHQATYDLGYLAADQSVMVNITSTATVISSGAALLDLSSAGSLTMQLLTQAQASTYTAPTSTTPTPVACAPSSTLSTPSAGVWICPVTATSNGNQKYVLRILRADTPMQADGTPATAVNLHYYQLTVGTYVNSSSIPYNSSTPIRTILQATDCVRSVVTKLVYFKEGGVYNISQFPKVGDIATVIRVFPTLATAVNSGSVYDFQTTAFAGLAAAAENTVTNMTDYVLTITTAGYYLIAIHIPTGNNFIRFIFPSDSYTCPYNSQYPDFHQNFQPCIGSGTGSKDASTTPIVPGYPCTSYDTVAKKCTQCFTGYILSSAGTCLYNTTCPDRQYYHFGVCYPVSPNCDSFDAFTGDCLNCTSPLNYVVNGSCIPNPALIPNCTARQYIVNNKCVDVSPLCKDFDSKTGGCTSCIDKYVLVAASASCVPRIIICPANQYLKNGDCVDFPANCGNFDVANQKCVNCNFGYYPNNGGCEKIICQLGKVPSKYGLFCIDVSPSCNQAGQYDTLTGDCLKCKNDGYTAKDGVCVQDVSPIAGCAARQALGYGPCGEAKINCQSYNLVTGDCDQCQPNWFKDYTGICTLRNDNSKCGGDEISIQGYCVQKPANCRIIDNMGLCTLCNGAQYRLQNGQCVEVKNCGSGQYRNSNGACVNAPAGCSNGSFNPSTGVCLTCNDGRPAVTGLCCTADQVAYQGQCITAAQYQSIVSSSSNSLVPTCISWHPTLGTCIQCNGDFEVDPVTMNSCI